MPKKPNKPQYSSSSYEHEFLPDEQAKVVNQHIDSRKNYTEPLASKNAFENYLSEHTADITKFTDLKTPSGGAVSSLSQGIKTELNKCLTLDIKEAQNNQPSSKLAHERDLFKAKMDALQDMMKGSWNIRHIATTLNDYKADAIKVIKEQHAVERKAVEDLFATDAFKQKLTGADGITAGKEEEFKKSLLTELDKSQTKEIEKLESALNEDAKKIHSHIEAQNAFISMMKTQEDRNQYRYNEALKQAEAKNAKLIEEEFSVSSGMDKATGTYTGMSLEDFDILRTKTGNKVKYDPDTKTLTMEFGLADKMSVEGSTLADLMDKRLADLTSMAQILKGMGYTQINRRVRFPYDKDRELELARLAYEGAAMAGFSTDPAAKKGDKAAINIYIGDSATPIDVNELFKGHEGRLTKIHRNTAANKQRAEILEDAQAAKTSASFKKELESRVEALKKDAGILPPADQTARLQAT